MTTKPTSLATIDLFSDLPAKALERIEGLLVQRDFPAGAEIIQEGDRGVAFFIVTSGAVEVLRGPAREQVKTLEQGEYFGEMALFGQQLRSATVRALEPTQCLVLSQWDFLAEVRANPDLAINLLASMAKRVRER
jgi:CRP/FNR family transcriptional regulator, cyclic AMP receptor protein